MKQAYIQQKYATKQAKLTASDIDIYFKEYKEQSQKEIRELKIIIEQLKKN